MYEFICLFGPATVTFLIARYLSRKPYNCLMSDLCELLMHAIVNFMALGVITKLLGGKIITVLTDGTKVVQYSMEQFIISFVLAVVFGIIFAIIYKTVDIEIEHKKRDE